CWLQLNCLEQVSLGLLVLNQQMIQLAALEVRLPIAGIQADEITVEANGVVQQAQADFFHLRDGSDLLVCHARQHPVHRFHRFLEILLRSPALLGCILVRLGLTRQPLVCPPPGPVRLDRLPHTHHCSDNQTTAVESCRLTSTLDGLRSRWMMPFWWAPSC